MLEIMFVRNARGDGDVLSQEGEAKCLRAGAILQEMGFRPDLVVTSNHQRSLRTGKLIAQGLGTQPRFAEVSQLQPPTPDQAAYDTEIASMFRELGVERPMSAYLARDTRGVLLGHAEEVAREIDSKLEGAQKMLIVGHHIMQNLVGIAYAGRDPILLGPHFAPLTGYWIHEDGFVTGVELVD